MVNMTQGAPLCLQTFMLMSQALKERFKRLLLAQGDFCNAAFRPDPETIERKIFEGAALFTLRCEILPRFGDQEN